MSLELEDFMDGKTDAVSLRDKYLKNINKNIKKTKITLIMPNVIGSKNQIRRVQPPLGIACLAGVLEECNFKNLQIIDSSAEGYDNIKDIGGEFIEFGLDDSEVVKKIKNFNPDIVGISALFSSQFSCAERLGAEIKKFNPNIVLVFGGIHASKMYEEILLKNKFIDYIIRGEADYTFTVFCNNFEENIDIKKETPSLAYFDDKIKKVVKNFEPPGLDMNELPMPAWHLMDMEMYWKIGMPHNPFMKSKEFLTIMTERGCPEKCYFCSSASFFGNSGKFRPLNPQKAYDMIEYAVNKFGVKEIQIEDDTFTLNSQRVIEFCKKIKKFKLRITLPNSIRADAPKNLERRLDMFRHMAEAGFEKLGISAEHGDQEFLDKIIQKRLDLNEIVNSIELAHKAGIMVHTNFMMGFPFETKNNRDKTINFAKSLKSDSFSVSLVAPLPGTKLYEIVKQNNLFMPDFKVDRIVYDVVNIIPHDISPEDLLNLVKKLNAELNAMAIANNPKLKLHYELIKNKNIIDRKYSHEIKKLVVQSGAHGSVIPN
jgi:anaerobic magnesium-protoporphyrin IX monomethyl ester cyclase